MAKRGAPSKPSARIDGRVLISSLMLGDLVSELDVLAIRRHTTRHLLIEAMCEYGVKRMQRLDKDDAPSLDSAGS